MAQQESLSPNSVNKFQYDNKKKRTELGQLLQILECLQVSYNTQISSIARFTNLSHDAATRNCEKLVRSGLVLQEIINNNKKYNLTNDGVSFLNYCRNFGDMLTRYSLGYILYH